LCVRADHTQENGPVNLQWQLILPYWRVPYMDKLEERC